MIFSRKSDVDSISLYFIRSDLFVRSVQEWLNTSRYAFSSCATGDFRWYLQDSLERSCTNDENVAKLKKATVRDAKHSGCGQNHNRTDLCRKHARARSSCEDHSQTFFYEVLPNFQRLLPICYLGRLADEVMDKTTVEHVFYNKMVNE